MLKLNYNTIKEITQGAARIEENEGFRFYRFSKEQEEVYRKYHNELLDKTFSTSGVCLEFKTDSKGLYLEFDINKSSSRAYFAFDILCNGEKICHIANFEDVIEPFDKELEFLGGEKQINLGEGTKTVKIVFPWSITPIIKTIGLDDNSMVEPTEKKEKILMFGDSITHGYDAIYPSESYAYIVSDKLGLEVYNKAIGGEVFFPELAKSKDDFVPKYITVAYGTNDWSHSSYDEFIKGSEEFFKALTQNYPETKIFALSPIWRKDYNDSRPMGEFDKIKNQLIKLSKEYENITMIDCFDFVPKDEKYFSDLRLHPNSKGFMHYGENLYKAIKTYI